ncbi:MAG: S-formylglutathione hydrolase [Steroidobacterales bacterium]
MTLETLSRHRAFGGTVGFYRHSSATTACTMRFAVFAPPAAEREPVPVLYYLAGLTCTEETFMIKAGAQRLAAELGLMLVAPDTSPRGAPLPGDSASWDFGVGAGFYLDATEEPWSKHYRMYSYVTEELPTLIAANFPADTARVGIFGHSMGGHGALTIALKNRERYRSISAFAPIVAPMQVPWGQKAFSNYLGADASSWRRYDATDLMLQAKDAGRGPNILIDQGLADQFLETQLQPQRFEEACQDAGYPLTLRRHDGYDHGYYFISTFIDDHLRHHARTLSE